MLAATFSFADHKLWVLDDTSATSPVPTVRLARLDLQDGTPQIIGTWGRLGLFDRWFLTVDRDGGILLSGSNALINSVVRFPTSGASIQPAVLVTQGGALALAPIVDEYNYTFYTWNALGALQVARRSLLNTDSDPTCKLLPSLTDMQGIF